MSRLTFKELVHVYRNARPLDDEGMAEVTVADQNVLHVLEQLIGNEPYQREVGLSSPEEEAKLFVGGKVRLTIDYPLRALGTRAQNLGSLLRSNQARMLEPPTYYLVDEDYWPGDDVHPLEIKKYRDALRLVMLLRETAAFADERAAQIVFVDGEKFLVPVDYSTDDIIAFDTSTIEDITASLSVDLHREQKLAMLGRAIVDIAKEAPKDNRFRHLLRNIQRVRDKFNVDYALFSSSFSYKKIRREMEAEQVDYLNKLHKTFTDIQNQVLGVPVAAVVVATQLELAGSCGKAFWGNFAVLIGSWIFGVLVVVSIINQYHTVSVVVDDVRRRQEALRHSYGEMFHLFKDIFWRLYIRSIAQRLALIVVACVVAIGVTLSTVAYHKLTGTTALTCVTTAMKPVAP